MFDEITIPSDVCIQLKDSMKKNQMALVIPSVGRVVFRRPQGNFEVLNYKSTYPLKPFFITTEMLAKEGTHLRIIEDRACHALVAYSDAKYKTLETNGFSEGYVVGGKYYDMTLQVLNSQETARIVYAPYTKMCKCEMYAMLQIGETYLADRV